MKTYYDPSAKELALANIGRNLMDISANMPMKGLSNDEIARSNRMAAFGDALTRMGTIFGPSSLPELLKKAGVSNAEAIEFIKLGSK